MFDRLAINGETKTGAFGISEKIHPLMNHFAARAIASYLLIPDSR